MITQQNHSSCSRVCVSLCFQSLSCVHLLVRPVHCSTPGLPVHHQLLELAQTHIHRVGVPSNYLILCRPLLLLPSVFPSIRVFSSESVLCIRWPKYWSFSLSISPSNEYSGLISKKSKRLSRVFSNTTVQKHQFFDTQLFSSLTIKQKSRFVSGFLWRYLADSNRRPRFCRPIPNRSGKVPNLHSLLQFGCKGTAFF